jgi:hypothetical protein
VGTMPRLMRFAAATIPIILTLTRSERGVDADRKPTACVRAATSTSTATVVVVHRSSPRKSDDRKAKVLTELSSYPLVSTPSDYVNTTMVSRARLESRSSWGRQCCFEKKDASKSKILGQVNHCK